MAVGLSVDLAASPIQVVTITEDFASIATSIGGELIEVRSLIKGSRNLHTIHPKPSMVLAVRKADLLIRLGMDQDGWIDGLTQVARNTAVLKGKPGHLDCSDKITKLEVPKGTIDKGHGDVHIHGNPHYWLDPKNGIIIAKQIKERLCVIDPKNKVFYTRNYQQFSRSLNKRIEKWQSQLESMSDTAFITYHKVWSYFFDGFGLTSMGELEPLPGIPPTTKHLAKLKQAVSSRSTFVLTASYCPEYVGKSFAKEIGARYKKLPANVGEMGIESYHDLFEFILKELKK